MFLLCMFVAMLILIAGITLESLYSDVSKKQLLGWIGLGLIWLGTWVWFVRLADLDTCSKYVDTTSCVLLMWLKQ